MKIRHKLVTLATAAVCLASVFSAHAAPTPLFNATYSSYGTSSDIPLVYGNRFTMTTTATATALGLVDVASDGFAETHQVGLWNATSGSLLASVTFGQGQTGTLGPGVNTPNPFDMGLRYLDIAGVVLQAGETYWLAAVFPAPISDGVAMASSFSSAYATDFVRGYAYGGSLVPPTTTFSSLVFGVDLLLAGTDGGGASVPEPSSMALMFTMVGALALTRRRKPRSAATGVEHATSGAAVPVS